MTNELKECFCPHVSDYQFLSSFIQSRKHFKAFSSFILPFSNSIYKVCQSSTYQILMNPNDAASFFVIHFNFVKGSQFILANIIGKDVKYISQFLHEVHKRIKPFGDAYSEVLIQNMKDLILSLLSSSSKKNRNLITDFLETNPIGYAKLYSILFNEINCIVSVVDNILNDVRQAIVDMEHFPHLIPTKEYFSILALCVNKGNFKKSVLLKANIYLDVLKKLYNVIPRTHLLNFLCTTILEFSEEFFGNMHNFVTYLDSFRALDPNCEPEVIQNFLDFVPYSHQFSAKFFSHAIFTNLAKNIFSNHINSEIFKEFILRHSNPDNWQLVIKIIWEKNIFEQNLNEKHSAYLQLTSEIIKRFPQSATIFLSRGMFFETLKDLSNKKGSNYFKNITSSADVAEILAVFTDSFFIESNSQKNSSYFGHRFRRNTYSHANNKKNEILGDDSRKFGSIVDNYNKYLNLLNIFAVVSYDKSGSFCRLLQSICVMSNDIKLQLFQLLATEEKSFIKRVPKNASKSAVSLVSCLCFLNINDPKVNDILVREMNDIESIEHFESLAKVAAVVRQNITKFTKVCTDFISQTQEVRAFQGPIRRLLFNVADNLCDTSFKCNINEPKRDIEIWDEKATNMLEEIISLKSTSKQNNDVAVLLSFMFECRRKHGVTPRKLSLNEQTLQCLEEIRLDIDISGTDAYDYIYAKA
ncbi:hypothetical protein TRFO_12842 [Tritrichomonas foetus]|uniref:Uncharacterized protein n=1 Tax=Tritrichomonas foetus TaxID=1144522 RepID=A0A1J4L0C0_9EUKA|nr:hypothetical protein TRFO_12842 [Tritrichomonas foetus]|eukprot:OHT16951.1 hypothetical protein TRFO_12842 [Tritrichomonas foetus]